MSEMDDGDFSALVESAIAYVDGQWGRRVAWALTISVIGLLIAAASYVIFR